MTQLLNLDDLAEIQKQIKLSGEVYVMKEASVKEYIQFQRDAKILTSKKNTDEFEDLELSMRMVGMCFPDIPKSVMDTLSFTMLHKILDFVHQTSDELAQAAEEESAAEDSEDPEKKPGK